MLHLGHPNTFSIRLWSGVLPRDPQLFSGETPRDLLTLSHRKMGPQMKPVESYVMFLGARGRRKRALPGWVCRAHKGNKQSRRGHLGSKRTQRSGSSPHRVITGLPLPTAEVKRSRGWPALSGGRDRQAGGTQPSALVWAKHVSYTQSHLTWSPELCSSTASTASLQKRRASLHAITLPRVILSNRAVLGHLCAYLPFPSTKSHFQSPGRSLTAFC